MAFHIKDYLVLFGPVHAWWTFPFERLIGMLQRMPNNGKIGELEETISASYTRAANLRALPLKAGCPEVLQNCEKIFAKLLDPYLRNTLPTDTNILDSLNDVDDLGESCDEDAMNPVPNDLKLALSAYLSSPAPRKARFLTQVTIGGLNYAVMTKHLGNSCAIVQTEVDVSPVPAQIHYIIQTPEPNGPRVYVGVRCYRPANLIHDPYAYFPALHAQLWDREPWNLRIIEPHHVVCHFARLDVYLHHRDLFATISLSRASSI